MYGVQKEEYFPLCIRRQTPRIKCVLKPLPDNVLETLSRASTVPRYPAQVQAKSK